MLFSGSAGASFLTLIVLLATMNMTFPETKTGPKNKGLPKRKGSSPFSHYVSRSISHVSFFWSVPQTYSLGFGAETYHPKKTGLKSPESRPEYRDCRSDTVGFSQSRKALNDWKCMCTQPSEWNGPITRRGYVL